MAGEYGDTIRTATPTQDAIADLIKTAGTVYAGVTSGAANAYTATSSPTLTTLYAGLRVRAVSNFTNAAGALTFNLNSISATRVYLKDGATNPPAGAIISGHPFELQHNGTSWALINGGGLPVNWTPSTGTQAGSLSSVVTTGCRYEYLSGSTFRFHVRVSATLSTSNSNYFTFTLPYASASLGYIQTFILHCEETSAGSPGSGFITDNSTTVQVYRAAAAQWTTGATRLYTGSFLAEIG